MNNKDHCINRKRTNINTRSIICLSLVFIFIVLSSCAKSESVRNAEKLINAIEPKTDDMNVKIQAAFEAYEALTEDEKKKVANYSDLLERCAEVQNTAETFMEVWNAEYAISLLEPIADYYEPSKVFLGKIMRNVYPDTHILQPTYFDSTVIPSSPSDSDNSILYFFKVNETNTELVNNYIKYLGAYLQETKDSSISQMIIKNYSYQDGKPFGQLLIMKTNGYFQIGIFINK
ncbi:MAG: hypothetical protein IJK00_08420 [Clostridia bacterium]|nr:hypothetical protein [Clostridia bacterium]